MPSNASWMAAPARMGAAIHTLLPYEKALDNKKNRSKSTLLRFLVREAGLEPARA